MKMPTFGTALAKNLEGCRSNIAHKLVKRYARHRLAEVLTQQEGFADIRDYINARYQEQGKDIKYIRKEINELFETFKAPKKGESEMERHKRVQGQIDSVCEEEGDALKELGLDGFIKYLKKLNEDNMGNFSVDLAQAILNDLNIKRVIPDRSEIAPENLLETPSSFIDVLAERLEECDTRNAHRAIVKYVRHRMAEVMVQNGGYENISEYFEERHHKQEWSIRDMRDEINQFYSDYQKCQPGEGRNDRNTRMRDVIHQISLEADEELKRMRLLKYRDHLFNAALINEESIGDLTQHQIRFMLDDLEIDRRNYEDRFTNRCGRKMSVNTTRRNEERFSDPVNVQHHSDKSKESWVDNPLRRLKVRYAALTRHHGPQKALAMLTQDERDQLGIQIAEEKKD